MYSYQVTSISDQEFYY